MAELARDLVQAVFDILCPPEDRAVYTNSEIEGWQRDAQLAVMVVSRRLAAKPDGYLRYQEDGGITYTRTLRELAEDLESILAVPQAGKP